LYTPFVPLALSISGTDAVLTSEDAASETGMYVLRVLLVYTTLEGEPVLPLIV
jgi:hypothetical protein